MECLLTSKSTTINIGSGKNISIIELAKIISNNYTHIAPRDGEAENTLADISIAKKVLNFEPTIDICDWINKKIIKFS